MDKTVLQKLEESAATMQSAVKLHKQTGNGDMAAFWGKQVEVILTVIEKIRTLKSVTGG